RNGSVAYTRTEQLLKVIPDRALAPNGSGRLSFHYHGIPVESVANLDISREQITALKKIQVATIDKKPGIVDENFMLLTPELLWYPTAGVGFNRVNFQSAQLDFARYVLNVEPAKNLSAVAPGRVEVKDGQFRFMPENELNALPLIIGPLEKRSLETDGVEYNLYVKPGHDYFSGFFTSIRDTMGTLIKAAKDDYELDELDLYLEFDRVNLVEVPIQFHAYERPYTQTADYIFPEMILIPEKGAGLSTLDFARFMHTAERQDRERENERSPKEIETDMFRRFLQATFFRTSTTTRRRGFDDDAREGLVNFNSGADYTTNPFCVFPLYYNYVTGISSPDYPVFNSMMEIYLKQGFEVSPRQGFTGGITDHERANLALKEKSMTDIFAGGKSELTSSLINQTGSYIFSALRNRVGMSNFDDFLYYYLEDHAFSEIP
ncbi:MAG: hypothetical protein KAT15_04435, partial [Bacteroidales bacterium]|nr:hypothetical protein [Bacteroidales bacterium]